ncbi:MAG: hypothetical protein C0502_08990 [Opitutus sp.]|nr:hypothetical protein [Opitutus sp.]
MQMKELNDIEMMHVHGGEVSSDTIYAAAIGVSVFALGALIVVATGGAAAPAVAVWGLGALGTAANGAAIAVSA